MFLIVLFDFRLRRKLGIGRDKFPEFVEIFWIKSLLPNKHVVVFAVCDKYLVKSPKILVVVCIHDSEHIHAIAFNLLDCIAIKSKRLKVFKTLQLFCLLQIRDIIPM